jgi:hypothetical protein
MDITTNSKNSTKNVSKPFARIAILLVISLGLFWFSEDFSPARLFEPQGTVWVLWISYAKDLIQPFALYFFICLAARWLKTWQARAVLAFAIPTLLEFGQFLYYRVSTTPHYIGAFDPVDILIYAIGVSLAVFVERQVFAKMLKFW